VRAIFVNGPRSVFVEREGALQAVAETFRDEAHLLEVARRLVGGPVDGRVDGMTEFRRADGSQGVVILPPAAPAGPVLALRRARAGQATLDGLVASGLLQKPTAGLLQLAVRSRLNVLVTGPQGSGKTALLVALLRDQEPGERIVTVAPHREFQGTIASRVELVAATALAGLAAAAAALEPALLVLDGVQRADVGVLAERLSRGAGMLAAVAPEAMSTALARAAEVVVRIERRDGAFRVVAVEDCTGASVFGRGADPAFAATLQARGLGEALAKLLA
jgi:pilus assembly protein CpaF